jgi:hypothetical protein
LEIDNLVLVLERMAGAELMGAGMLGPKNSVAELTLSWRLIGAREGGGIGLEVSFGG